MCGKPSASVVHHEGDRERLFSTAGALSVTTRRSSQIHPSLRAQRAPTRKAEVQAEEQYHGQSRLACRVGRRAFGETDMASRVDSAENFSLTSSAPRRASATVARGQGRHGPVNVRSTEVSRDQTLPAVGRGPSPRPPRFHPGITRKVAPNESQREPKSLTSEVLIYDGLFVARWIWCPFGKGS